MHWLAKHSRRGTLVALIAAGLLLAGNTVAASVYDELLNDPEYQRLQKELAELGPVGAAEKQGQNGALMSQPQAVAPVRLLIDVRSAHSDGMHTISELARYAKARGIEVMAVTDHDRTGIRFGLEPIPQILGYTEERPSLYTTGLPEFFGDLAHVQDQFPGIRFMAGTESTPGYYWHGIPFRDLTLVNAERHIIALGIERARQIELLPSYSLEYARGNREVSLAVWGVLIFILLLLPIRRRKAGAVLLLLAFAGVAGAYFSSPDSDDADAAFIAEAGRQGLFTIWAHPGTLSGVREGPMSVHLDTPPYSERVFMEPTANAFAAVYGDTDSNTEPGGAWDRYLVQYAHGKHASPLWGVAAGDFHGEGEYGVHVGDFPMDLWLEGTEEKGPGAVLSALKAGRMVSWQVPQGHDLKFAALFVEDTQGRQILPGGKLKLTLQQQASLQFIVNDPNPKPLPVMQAQLIVDGKLTVTPGLKPGTGTRVPLNLGPGEHVIRLRIPSQYGVRMEANPFFVEVAD